MLQFKNRTPFSGTILVLPDPDGVDTLYAIVKATFVLGEGVVVADKQAPVRQKDEFLGEPGQSSIKAAGDVALTKSGTDVLLVGTAYVPAGKPASQVDVGFALGPVRKTVRVFGDRVWQSGIVGARISSPQPFERMPLVWERAFGGTDQTTGDPAVLHAENRNPVGSGFRLGNGQRKLEGLKLPNLEDPKQLIAAWKDRPKPAGFAPLCPHWEPRRTYAGTYDEAWQKQRAPYLPSDFDTRFFQLAPPDQVAPGYLRGGEPAEILGATPSGSLRFQLPAYHVQITCRLNNREQLRPADLDTVLVEPDESRLVMVWRAAFPCDKKALRVREVEAALVQGVS